MLIKTKSKSALKMLITLFLTFALILGIYLAIPKQTTQVSAAESGSSAVLKGYTSVTHEGSTTTYSGSTWLKKLANPVTKTNIVSIRITTDSNAINGFTQGVNVKDDTSENDLYYYYKANSSDSSKYDVIIYADVETIYAPVISGSLFCDLTNCKSIKFDNFDTSNVTDMRSMFSSCSSLTSLDVSGFNTSKVTDMHSLFYTCSSLTSLDVSGFNTSNVTNMSGMFVGLQFLKTLNISNFSFASIDTTNEDATIFMLGMSDTQFGQLVIELEGEDLDNYVNLSFEEKVAFLTNAGMWSEEDARQALLMCSDGLSTIIAPNDLNGLEISLPSTYEYTDASGNKISTDILVAGKTHTLPSASSDVNETGIISDSIILSLLALCFAISGFMMLKKKKIR